MPEPTTTPAPAPPVIALAPVAWLGLVLAGCPDCRAVIGVDGAPGLAHALAAHRPTCPAATEVCPGCGCEAQLYPHGQGWRCGDCLGERLFDTLASPPAPARPRPRVRAVPARHRRTADQGATDPAPAEPRGRAVA